uniref:C2H2-type domain-containing protein n=1 Tax=Trichuris muris TaxID=70415 RepID=A0A5S6QB15_TRIMR
MTPRAQKDEARKRNRIKLAKRHKREHHKQLVIERLGEMHCIICQLPMASKSDYLTHMADKHSAYPLPEILQTK